MIENDQKNLVGGRSSAAGSFLGDSTVDPTSLASIIRNSVFVLETENLVLQPAPEVGSELTIFESELYLVE